ncbi:Thioredoxin domain protein [Denitrovibrio acetiphilus DSM 12809]|uniref:Thioredoxin domain protein n=1 Tax=Denitrovibrio acetiphilus (strain DSM 12809 / NBRC 114555 / N2460) TaxID=522772 RepID=D4H297_DENA2|nr:thioredoxin family protein [Denitrovibrio acetiphilus]ADD68888.1 Thioredoxin domain protein [Denitrovibrio acetiphilus DSM 12809]
MLKNKHASKILILMVVLMCVTGIWFLKKSNTSSEVVKSNTAPSDFSLNVVDKIDLNKLISYKIPIIIDFGADSCIPCKKMAPVLAALNSELQGKAIIKFVDVWKYGSLAQGFPVRVIPTQIFINPKGESYKPSHEVLSKINFQSAVISGIHYTFHEGGLAEDDFRIILNDMETQ